MYFCVKLGEVMLDAKMLHKVIQQRWIQRWEEPAPVYAQKAHKRRARWQSKRYTSCDIDVSTCAGQTRSC